MSKRPTAIDLFSGCGGLTLGLKQAGFSVLAGLEIDSKAQATYELNHPEIELYRNDIRAVDVNQMMTELGLAAGELDLLAGCPPCQGFSRLRTRNRTVAAPDPRNDLIEDYARFVRTVRPRNVMLENVPALQKDRRFVEFLEELEALGYEHVHQVVDAADYGVPQRRRRLILLASSVGKPVVAPKSDYKVTVRDAIGSLEPVNESEDLLHAMPERRSERVREIIKMIPLDGGSRKDLPRGFQLDCHRRSDGFSDVYGRMRWDSVAPTITSGCHNPSKGRFLHPAAHRAITLREAAILQGFPRDYRFKTSHGKEAVALMIGNALPPPLICAHAKALIKR